EIEVTGHRGYALIDQEVEIGLRSIAVPLKSVRGQTVAALNVGLAASVASMEDLV
ncbi:IclR family transcriptional regulator, partial [Rhizobium sp. BR5]